MYEFINLPTELFSICAHEQEEKCLARNSMYTHVPHMARATECVRAIGVNSVQNYGNKNKKKRQQQTNKQQQRGQSKKKKQIETKKQTEMKYRK